MKTELVRHGNECFRRLGRVLSKDDHEGERLDIISWRNWLFAVPADSEIHFPQLQRLVNLLAGTFPELEHGIWEHKGKDEGERDKYLLLDVVIHVPSEKWAVWYASMYLASDGPGHYVRPVERFNGDRFEYVGPEL